MTNYYSCEICGIARPESELNCSGWSTACIDDPEYRRPMLHPRQRDVATLTTEILDDLEWIADGSEDTCTLADVHPAVLRALIDAARRDLSRDPDDIPIADLGSRSR